MENYTKLTNSKRFVVEDSITKVTSDGEPHELMTMIAGLSGLFVAIIILAILASMVGSRKSKHSLKTKASAAVSTISINGKPNDSMRTPSVGTVKASLLLYDTKRSNSIDSNNSANNCHESNLNAAYVSSSLNLNEMQRSGNSNYGSSNKQRQQDWQATVAAEGRTRESYIQVERY